MALTTQQKNTVAQFVALTGAGDKIAQRFLKNANYKLEVAVDHPPAAKCWPNTVPPPEMCLRGLFPYSSNKPAPARKKQLPLQSESGSGSSTPPIALRSRPPSPTDHSAPRDERAIRPVPVAAEARSTKAGSAAVVPPAKTPEMNSLRFIKQVGKGKGYYSSNQAVQSSSRSDAALEKMFDEMRDPNEDQDKDTIGVDSMMNYLTTLEVNPESCEIFVVLEIVRAASFGQITRKGFVDGWKLTGVTPSIPSHKQYIRNCVSQLSRDPAYFKKVYRHTFIAGKEPDQKALSVENALVYWEMMFNPPGRPWATARTDWFAAWKTFLDANWKRSVNRDMWNQTLEFANKSLEDDALAFWTEDAAWPSVIDQFVVWCRAEGVVAAAGADGMEVE